ncbi:tyrosine-protein phosphatase [Neptunomonas japonica]|uniref:tyrosine-protein phosphatase n=1 Tax=Neptunomonas japonica TaxID=417574 RepID=UPI00041270F5|nr:CpsB/CapC family capsule biosynthesis tyrosine phosphatase [Neptunomonas japonica]
MIDLHCHLLPGVDDGAENLPDAMELARMAVADGIRHMVLTPHLHPGRYDNSLAGLQPHFDAFKQALDEQQVPLSLSLACEVRLSAEVLQLAATNVLPFIGKWNGYDVLLLELPHSHIPPGSDKLVKWLLARNIIPMIAHPERNKDIVHNLDKILPFVNLGCLFQVTAMSVTGEFGAPAYQRAHEILENDWVTVIATDAHNRQHRPPILSKARHLIEQMYGAARAQDLFINHPFTIVGITASSEA